MKPLPTSRNELTTPHPHMQAKRRVVPILESKEHRLSIVVDRNEARAESVGFGCPIAERLWTMEREDATRAWTGSRWSRKSVSTPVDS